MIVPKNFHKKTVAVFGLARSGWSAMESLSKAGANVLVWDDDKKVTKNINLSNVEKTNLYDYDFSKIDSLVLSPGIPLHYPEPHKIVSKALQANCEVIGDIELFFRTKILSKVVGITGTNGKSTATSLLQHVLVTNQISSQMGGNIGKPILTLDKMNKNGIYIIELSSYQIDLTPSLNCEISILLNISPDHIDRHGDLKNYISSKKRIFEKNNSNKLAIIGTDDQYSKKIFDDLRNHLKNVVSVSVGGQSDSGIYVIDGILYDGRSDNLIVADLNGIHSLRGEHNWQNASAVYLAAKEIGLSDKKIQHSFKTFSGLPHRLESVKVFNGIEFINDSKATNINASANAIKSFFSIYWILGGEPKDDNLEPIKPLLNRIKHIYLIGKACNIYGDQIKHLKPVTLSKTLDRAFRDAVNDALKDPFKNSKVLFSPACASFDQFKDYHQRGEMFKNLVFEFAGVSNV